MMRLRSKIDDSPMSSFQVMIVVLCVIINMNDGIDVLIVSFSGSEITQEWALSKTDMGYIYSAGLLGMTIGALAIAPFADKIGRKKIFILSLILISAGMLSVSVCNEYWQMISMRILTGLGIGGLLPTMAATATEFSNNKWKDFNVALVQAGWPIGAIATGFFCAHFIPLFGWRFAFFVAGIIALLMLLMVIILMQDPIEFLVKKNKEDIGSINKLLVKMKQTPVHEIILDEKSTFKNNYTEVFSDNYKMDTFKLWIAAFFGFMTLYTLMSWIPTIAKDSGLPFNKATYVGIALNIGAAIGSSSIGWLGSKFGLRKVILMFMVSAFVIMQLYGNLTMTTGLIFILVLFIGVFVQGGFNGIWPTLSRVYPSGMRSTGTGLTVGIGRLGAILGPLIFGIFSDSGFSIKSMFFIFSIPLLINGILIYLIQSKKLEI